MRRGVAIRLQRKALRASAAALSFCKAFRAPAPDRHGDASGLCAGLIAPPPNMEMQTAAMMRVKAM